MSEQYIASYLLRWEQAFDKGQDLTPEELCVEHPELAPKIAMAVEVMRRLRRELNTPTRDYYSSLDPGTTEWTPTKLLPTDAVVTIPGYEILREIAHGGMGVVYEARQTSLNRLVALKMIRGSQADDEDRRRFLVEAEAVARIQHPNIVQIYDLGTHEGRPYFSMELCPTSLAKRLGGAPISVDKTARLMEPIARAVQAAHVAKILHRDLKPSNVLLSHDETPRVTDFGLAKRLENVEHSLATGAVVGTPNYMPPEQALGQKDIGPLADVYSLGAILYECLTGRPPFLANSVMETLAAVVADDPVPVRRLNHSVPVDMETICLKCLQKDPGLRYVDAAALADDLARFLKGEPIHARPLRWAERLWRWSRGKPLRAAFIAAAPLLGVILSAWIVVRFNNQNYQRQVLERSQVVLSLGEASRDYARQTLAPAVRKAVKGHDVGMIFEAESATFVARGTFEAFRKRQVGYSFREAALNPLNLANLATEHEATLIEHFRTDPRAKELAAFRPVEGGEEFYVARPIIVQRVCLQCHTSPETAPPELVAAYGRSHGYGWREGEVIGAIIVTVPADDLHAELSGMFWMSMILFGGLLVIIVVDFAVLLRFVRPKRRS